MVYVNPIVDGINAVPVCLARQNHQNHHRKRESLSPAGTNSPSPAATHAGWNLRSKGFIEDELCYLNGMHIPFANTKEEREKSGDPRLSIEERYKDQTDYIQRVSHAARTLVNERLLLPEDAERIIKPARKPLLFAERRVQ